MLYMIRLTRQRPQDTVSVFYCCMLLVVIQSQAAPTYLLPQFR